MRRHPGAYNRLNAHGCRPCAANEYTLKGPQGHEVAHDLVRRSTVSLREERQALVEDVSLKGLAFCRAYSAAADARLSDLLTDAAGGTLQGLALVAVGGYGREELCPHSDLDVVLIHRQRRDVKAVADSVWYPVWDEGVRLDHSVRTPAEVLTVAGEDLRVQLGLLDARLVAGDPEVSEPVVARARELWRSRAPRWLPVLADQVALRHRKHGDVAFLLEPDLKEAHGGLRDLSGLHAAVLASPALGRSVDLSDLDGARSILLSVRVELHRRSSRAADTLLLQDQDAVAEALSYSDADALMLDVARAGRDIAWVSDDLWSRGALWQVTRKRRRWLGGGVGTDGDGDSYREYDAETQVPLEIEPGIGLSDRTGGRAGGEVVLTADADPVFDPTLALRLAAVSAERGLSMSRVSLNELARLAPPPPVPWPDQLRTALVRVLATGPSAVRALEALDHYGIFSRLLPEWDTVRNKPQRNAYHRFTVDRHLLEAATQASALTVRVARPDLLLVAALLHDIGKGSPGDHTDVGVEIVARMAVRMGFPEPDVESLVNLVRNHLLLADLATRRDLDDPATVSAVTRAVGDRQNLDLLAALTEADSLATGPAAWGTWKAGLVADLVKRAAALLEGDELPPPATALRSAEHRTLMSQVRSSGAKARPVIVPGDSGVPRDSSVTVVAPDRPGLLASVTGVLCLHGLDVRSADVASEDGVALEVFVVDPAHGRWPDWATVSSDLDDVLAGRLELDEQLAKRSAAYDRRRVASGPIEVKVTLDNSASAGSTVVEIRARDEVAMLHRVTAALFANELDVVAARAFTLGDQIIDAFYVRDRATGAKVDDHARLKQIGAAIQDLLVESTFEGAPSAKE